MGCLHDPANVQQTSSKCIQNTRANAERLLDHVKTLSATLHPLQTDGRTDKQTMTTMPIARPLGYLSRVG